MDWEEDEGEEDDQEAGQGYDHSSHYEPGGDGWARTRCCTLQSAQASFA